MKNPYFPVYTQVGPKPIAVCEKLPISAFSYPFFNDAVPIVRPNNSIRKELPLTNGAAFSAQKSLTLAGFIFHTSHCGSTLLANMFGASTKTRVVSETEAINGVLLSAIFYGLSEDEILIALETVISAYLQPLGAAQQVVFKLTSWNVFFVELFQKIFPKVPWIYIHREPEAVVKSLMTSGRGFLEWWHHPTDLLRNYFLGEIPGIQSLEQFLFAMVEGHKTASKKGNAQNRLLMEYPHFIGDFERQALPHFHLNYTEEELARARECIQFDAKSFHKTQFRKK